MEEKKNNYDDISSDSDVSNEIKPLAGNDVPSRVVWFLSTSSLKQVQSLQENPLELHMPLLKDWSLLFSQVRWQYHYRGMLQLDRFYCSSL